MAHANDVLARRHCEALEAGDLDMPRELLAPEVAWHVPGHGPLSGTYAGVEAVLSLFGRIYDMTDGTYRTAVEEVIADDAHAVVLLTVRATIAGTPFEDAAVHVAPVEGGRIGDVPTWSADQPLFDGLLDEVLAVRG